MFESVKLLESMSAMARHAAARHALIADNIANADTPGYKAKDLQPFAEVFAKARMNGESLKGFEPETVLIPTHGLASPNGNTVSLEQQMMLSAQNKGEHEMALAVYRKSMDMLKMTVSKNL